MRPYRACSSSVTSHHASTVRYVRTTSWCHAGNIKLFSRDFLALIDFLERLKVQDFFQERFFMNHVAGQRSSCQLFHWRLFFYIAIYGKMLFGPHRFFGCSTLSGHCKKNRWTTILAVQYALLKIHPRWRYFTLETPQSKTATCYVCKATTPTGKSSVVMYNVSLMSSNIWKSTTSKNRRNF